MLSCGGSHDPVVADVLHGLPVLEMRVPPATGLPINHGPAAEVEERWEIWVDDTNLTRPSTLTAIDGHAEEKRKNRNFVL